MTSTPPSNSLSCEATSSGVAFHQTRFPLSLLFHHFRSITVSCFTLTSRISTHRSPNPAFSDSSVTQRSLAGCTLLLLFGSPNLLRTLSQHAARDRHLWHLACCFVLWNTIAITIKKKKGITIECHAIAPVDYCTPIRYLGVHCRFDGDWSAQHAKSTAMIQLFARAVSKFQLSV